MQYNNTMPPAYQKELSEWEFDKLVLCKSTIAETMLLQRVRVTDSKPLTTSNLEEGLFEYLGVNTRALYYIQRGYCNFTVYFENAMDRDDFNNLVEKYTEKTR